MERKGKIIALTGGIGSGKSTALKILSGAGFRVLSSDEIVSELYEKRRVKKFLKHLFPTAVKGLINLKIDRKEIARITFSDKVKHKELTDTVTKMVLKEILARGKKFGGVVFAEVPLLFECGFTPYFDGVMVITRDKTARIESVKSRSNLTEEQILSRMQAQVDYEKFDLTPFRVIVNDGDENALKEKVLAVAKSFR